MTQQQNEPFDYRRMGMGMGGAMLGGGLGQMFGGRGRNKEAMGYLDQIPGQISPYYDPYINAGRGALGGLQDQYGQLTNDPGGKYNQIGQSFHESPGFKFALQQALGGAGHAAAAGGMAGSPQHEQQNMDVATGLANQDYNNYMQGATGLYGQGLQGMQGMAGMGLQAGNSMADQISQMMAAKSKLAYENQAGKNSMWGSLLGGLGGLAGWFL